MAEVVEEKKSDRLAESSETPPGGESLLVLCSTNSSRSLNSGEHTHTHTHISVCVLLSSSVCVSEHIASLSSLAVVSKICLFLRSG